MNTRFFLGLLSGLALSIGTGAVWAKGSLPPEDWKSSQKFSRLSVNWEASSGDKEKAEKAWRIISQWLEGAEKVDRPLHVVYVAIKDRPPLEGYKERLDRIVKNIQAYYADQMEENGFPPLTFALDLDEEGKLVVHDAYLDRALDTLDTHSSGPPTREVANKVLKEKGIDPEHSHILIVAQIPDKQGPYYGMGNAESGCCWVCDAVHLDTKNFKSTEKGTYRFGTLGKDNSVYIGGTAHELGHCFGLPHTSHAATPAKDGSSLMGDGNYTYGEDLRGESKGTFLIQSDALRLAAVPLFNRMKKSVPGGVEAKFSDFNAKSTKDGLEISGVVRSQFTESLQNSDKLPPVYGLVAYFDPEGGNDYDSTTTTVIPDAEGKFTIQAPRPGYEGAFELRLVSLMADGSTSTMRQNLVKTKTGVDVSPLLAGALLSDASAKWANGDVQGALAELDKVMKKHADNAGLVKKAALWKFAMEASFTVPKGESPAEVSTGTKKLSLTDARPVKSSSGWGSALWNVLPENPLGPLPIFPSGFSPERFMYTHAEGEFTYDLGGAWKTFSAIAGIPIPAYGNVIVVILADGKEVYKSSPLRDGKTESIKLDVSGVKTLTIQAKSNKSDNNGNWCVIADPVLER